MKTSTLKKAFHLLLFSALPVLSLTGCKDKGSVKMDWDISSTDDQNVEFLYNPQRKPQIEILASAEGGECELKCPNYQNLSLREQSLKANTEAIYEAEVTGPGVIKVKFDKLTDDSSRPFAYFIIEGFNGKEASTTVVKVTRKV